MGTIEWIALGGLVVVAVVVLIVVDHFRGPKTCDVCGEAKGIMKMRKVNGKWRTVCRECEG